MKRKKSFYNSFKDSFFEARFLYKDNDPDAKKTNDVPDANVAKPKDAAETKNAVAKTAVKSTTKRETTKAKSGVERQSVKTEIELDQVFTSTNVEGYKKNLDWWKLNVRREKLEINAHSWKPETKPGLEKMFKDWNNIGIPINNPFYLNVKKQLAKSSDSQFLTGVPKQKKDWYLNPSRFKSELQDADKHFYEAWKFHESIKDFMTLQDTAQNLTADKVKDLDKDSIATKVTDGLKKNLTKFKDAIKSRDYATAGVYVLGVWAMWKAYKSLPEGKQSTIGKFLIWGTALYAGNSFAKNAGYDIMKKLGLKHNDAEVRGTPLEALVRLRVPEAKNIDMAIYLRTENINLKNLHGQYVKANKNGVRFIDPALFPDQFPHFQHMSPMDAKEDKDYRFHGEQLYLIIHCLEEAYEKTFKLDEGKKQYYGKSFEQALNDGTLKASNVRQFTGALLRYAPSLPERKLFMPDQLKKANSRFSAAFKGTGMGAWIELTPISAEKPNAAVGRIMDFPIVVVADSSDKQYYIFSRKEYEANKGVIDKGSKLGSIPFEGDTKEYVKDIETKITDKVEKLLDPIIKSGGKVEARPQFKKGKWRCKYKIKDMPDVDIAQEESEAVFEFFDSGIVQLDVATAGISINLGDLSPDFLHENYLLGKLVAKKEFNALRPFYNNRTLHFVDNSMSKDANGDTTFKIRLLGEEVLVTYNKATESDIKKRKFKIDIKDQKRLIENSEFRREYAKARAESRDFKKVFDELKMLISNAPEQFHMYFFEGIKNWFTSGTIDKPLRGLNLQFVSGSVKDYYGKSVVDSQKAEITYALLGSLENANNFSDISRIEAEAVNDKLSALKAVAKEFNEKNINKGTKGEAWEDEEFAREIYRKIQYAGNSKSYSHAYRDFELAAINYLGLSGSDIFKSPHLKLNRVKAAYTYYTAHLDRTSLDSSDKNRHKHIGKITPKDALDKFILAKEELEKAKKTGDAKKIAKAEAEVKKTKIDADIMDDLQRIGYLKYVKGRVLAKAKSFSEIPDPEASKWDIMPYEEWKVKDGRMEPLDDRDELPAFDHDPKHANNKNSKLDEELISRINQAKSMIIKEYGKHLKPRAIERYLNRSFKETGSSGKTILVKRKDIGYFTRFPIDPKNPKSKPTSKLWSRTNDIHSAAGGKRSLQIDLMEREVSNFVETIFLPSNRNRFWKKPVSLSAKIIKKFPSLAKYL